MGSASFLVELPYRMDFKFHLNADFLFEYFMELEDATPINNTGYRIDMEVRREPGSVLIATYSTTNGRITLGGATGKVTIAVPWTTIVTTYTDQQYRYDILEFDALGFRQPIYYGEIEAIAMITLAAL